MRTALLLVFAGMLSAQAPGLAEKARMARELVVAGKPEQAIPLYEELVRAFPNDPAMIVNLAIADFKVKRYREAIQQAEAALRLQPDLAIANLFLGASWAELGEPARAVTPLEKAVISLPNDRNARVMLADALFSLERYPEAATHFQTAATLSPENPKVWYGLGRIYEALAAQMAQQLEKTGSPYALVLGADAYVRQRRYGNAHANYKRALRELPAFPGLHTGLAAVYKQTGHPEWAAAEEELESKVPPCGTSKLQCDFAAGRYQQIIESPHAPNSPEALYWTAKAYHETARAAYDHLVKLPPSLEHHLHTAQAYDSEGLALEAAREWRAALKLAPGNHEVQTGLVWSLFRGNDYESLLPLASEFLRTQPDSRDLNFVYGATLLNFGQPEKAIPYLEIAIRHDSLFLPAQAALGHALLRAGKPEPAIPLLKAALATDEDGSSHFQLLRAYQVTGQADLARRALAEYQEFQKSAEEKERAESGATITR